MAAVCTIAETAGEQVWQVYNTGHPYEGRVVLLSHTTPLHLLCDADPSAQGHADDRGLELLSRVPHLHGSQGWLLHSGEDRQGPTPLNVLLGNASASNAAIGAALVLAGGAGWFSVEESNDRLAALLRHERCSPAPPHVLADAAAHTLARLATDLGS